MRYYGYGYISFHLLDVSLFLQITQVTQVTMNVRCSDGVLDMRPIMAGFIMEMHKTHQHVKPTIQHCGSGKFVFTWTIPHNSMDRRGLLWGLQLDERGIFIILPGSRPLMSLSYADFCRVEMSKVNAIIGGRLFNLIPLGRMTCSKI